MCCSYAMMSLSDTSLVEEEGAEQDRAEREGEVAESNCRDLNYTSIRLTVAAFMAHMTEKWLEEGKGIEKWHKIHVIAKGKTSLSRVAVSLYTSIIERIKFERKSIVRCSRRENL